MSGFFCVFDRTGAPVDRQLCRALLGDIADTGPHASGISWPHHFVGLAHCRRNDTPESASATLPLTRGGCTLVCDARLDARDELRAALGDHDHVQPDSELLLKAYLAWGLRGVEHLVGEFSFALWDEGEQRLVCGRDHMGDRALYFTVLGELIVCSNEFRVPRSWPGVSHEVDELSVAALLVRRGLFMRFPERTLFRDIHQLPAGHLLVATQQDVRTSCYWSIRDLEPESLPRAPLSEHHEHFRDILHAAVGCRLRSASPLGSHLSGGLDSSSVVCVAAAELQRSGRRLPCFTHLATESIADVSPTRTVREEPFVDAVAAQYPNIDLHFVSGTGQALLDGLEHQFYYGGVAHPNHYQTWWYGILELGSSLGLGTMLTGVSGNLTASWVGTPRPPEWRSWLGSLRQRILPRGGSWRQASVLRAEVAERLGIDDHVAHARWEAGPAFGLSRGANGLYRSFSIGRYGIELRDPLGDRRIVEFCLRAPQTLFRRGGRTRLLIREALVGIVPERVLQRRSRQLQSADWVERTHEAGLALSRSVEALAKLEVTESYVDWAEVRRLLTSPPQLRGDMKALRLWNTSVLGAIAVGRFLAWVDQGCRAPTTDTPA